MKTLRIGIAGLGTVGRGVARILESNSELLTARTGCHFTITAVSARDKNKDRGLSLRHAKWFDDASQMADDPEIDTVIELIGGDSGTAYALVKQSLSNGKHVITANKALIARHGTELAAIAEEKQVQLAFEAAVAGGIPILKALREGLVANRLSSVSGILNGTCNYILTQMKETAQDFTPILAEAQKLGYAEADPAFDVDGIDAAHKLAILSSLAFGTTVAFDQVYVEGIRHISLKDIIFATELGFKVKLLGIAKRTGDDALEQRVHPCLVPADYPIARVDGVLNAVYAQGDFIGRLVMEGPGAGEGPTASSVICDLADIACGRVFHPFGVPVSAQQQISCRDISETEGEYYLRIPVSDQPKVLASITAALAEHGVSIESVLQKPSKEFDNVDIVVITHTVREAVVKKALEKITQLDKVTATPQLIRIER